MLTLSGFCLLLPSITSSFSTSFSGLADLFSRQEESARIALAPVLAYPNGSDVELLIYNYGGSQVEVRAVFVGSVSKSFRVAVFSSENLSFCPTSKVPPSCLFKLSILNTSSSDCKHLSLLLNNGIVKEVEVR